MSNRNVGQLNNASSDRFERRKQKKAVREAEALKTRRKKKFKKINYWIAGLAIVIGGGWLLITATGPKGPDYSQSVEVLGRNHIQEGTIFNGYNSNPPTSGPHYANPANIRFYTQPLPDEQVVHNLEHGQVWIAYKPNLSPEAIKVLKGFAGGNTIVTPRSANDFEVALAAWGRLDKFKLENNQIDKQRVKDFISRYRNRGPESVGAPGRLK